MRLVEQVRDLSLFAEAEISRALHEGQSLHGGHAAASDEKRRCRRRSGWLLLRGKSDSPCPRSPLPLLARSSTRGRTGPSVACRRMQQPRPRSNITAVNGRCRSWRSTMRSRPRPPERRLGSVCRRRVRMEVASLFGRGRASAGREPCSRVAVVSGRSMFAARPGGRPWLARRRRRSQR
jgi:hypothetical protein